jgi:hypothetical protein
MGATFILLIILTAMPKMSFGKISSLEQAVPIILVSCSFFIAGHP